MSTFFVSVSVSKKEEPKTVTTGGDTPRNIEVAAPYYPPENITINKEVEAETEAEAVKSVVEQFSKLG